MVKNKTSKTGLLRKVERQPYHDLGDMLPLAIQAEQHIKKKTAAPSRSQSVWNPTAGRTAWSQPTDHTTGSQPTDRTADKAKAPATDDCDRTRRTATELQRPKLGNKGKSSNPLRTRDLTCFKCKGRGHMAREGPNQRVMILTPTAEYESQDEEEDKIMAEDEVEYPDVGELLVTRRVLSAMVEPEIVQRENIFHTRCTIGSKVCSLIIDGGSCTNVTIKYLVEKLDLKTQRHPRPYKLRWLIDESELKIA